jgi:oxygen-independent coproporphyrinogen-3 oxidase
MSTQRPVLLNIIVPFCVNPCGWRPGCKIIPGWDSDRQKTYMEAVQQEIKANADQFGDVRITAVRFGGGVASNAGEHISHTMRLVRKLYDVANDAQVTMRSSISNISGANMPWFKRAGIQRFDFEMMSMNQIDFSILNRNDAWADFIVMCDYLLKTYMTELLGLILCWGHSAKNGDDAASIANFRKSVTEAATTHASHIRLLEYQGQNPLPASAAIKAEQAEIARKVFLAQGFREYSPLHFGRGSFAEDRYFIARAEGSEVIGFGLGAETRFDGALSVNTSDLTTYLTHANDFSRITVAAHPL